MSIRIDPDLADVIRRCAADTGKTVTEVIEEALRERYPLNLEEIPEGPLP